MRRWRSAAASLAAMLACGCAIGPPAPLPEREPASTDPTKTGRVGPDAADLRRAGRIEALTRHLAASMRADGWFAYRMDADGRELGGYNIVRHAGALFALAQVLQAQDADIDAGDRRSDRPPALPASTTDAAVRVALNLGARRLIDCCIAAAGTGSAALAVWWPPHLHPPADRAPAPAIDARESAARSPAAATSLASLGATGLGLTALIGVDALGVIDVPIAILRGLGRFLLAMQAPDGRFRSRWFADGRDDDWRSLYYPGEAALALIHLARHDPDPEAARRWQRAGVDALLALAEERRGHEQVPPDHWALIATGALGCSASELPGHQHRSLTTHAWQVAMQMIGEQAALMGEQVSANADPQPLAARSAYTADGRMTPNSVRLEGLFALQAWPLPADAQARVDASRTQGLAWLELALDELDKPGAVTRFAPASAQVQPVRSQQPRENEIRIDYVQHALSALLMARALEQRADAAIAPTRLLCKVLLPAAS